MAVELPESKMLLGRLGELIGRQHMYNIGCVVLSPDWIAMPEQGLPYAVECKMKALKQFTSKRVNDTVFGMSVPLKQVEKYLEFAKMLGSKTKIIHVDKHVHVITPRKWKFTIHEAWMEELIATQLYDDIDFGNHDGTARMFHISGFVERKVVWDPNKVKFKIPEDEIIFI